MTPVTFEQSVNMVFSGPYDKLLYCVEVADHEVFCMTQLLSQPW